MGDTFISMKTNCLSVDICFFGMGTLSCFLVALSPCYECLRLCLLAQIACRRVAFFFFNVTGGICWACLFGFGAYAVGTEIYKISETMSLVSLGLFIAGGSALSIIIRRYEIVLLRQAERGLPDR
jgi:hypothetical protein